MENKQASGSFQVFLSSASDQDPLPEQPKSAGEQDRRRRCHRKSRRGCSNCKARRKKCDETYPECKNCIKKNELCGFLESTNSSRDALRRRNNSCRKVPSHAIASTIRPALGQTQHLQRDQQEAFYHFTRVTVPTLAYSGEAWLDSALPLAFEYPFLMESILTLSASHLRYLMKEPSRDRIFEFTHLSQALSGLREAVSDPSPSEVKLGAMLLAGVLLQHHAWTFIDENEQLGSCFGIYANHFFSLLWCLKGIFVEWKKAQGHISTLSNFSTRKSRMLIHEYLEKEHILYPQELAFESYFALDSTLSTLTDSESATAYLTALERLSPILSIMRNEASSSSDRIASPIARYLFAWPAHCRFELRVLFENAGDALNHVLLNYYNSVSELVGKRFWWAEERAQYYSKTLHGMLTSDVCQVAG